MNCSPPGVNSAVVPSTLFLAGLFSGLPACACPCPAEGAGGMERSPGLSPPVFCPGEPGHPDLAGFHLCLLPSERPPGPPGFPSLSRNQTAPSGSLLLFPLPQPSIPMLPDIWCPKVASIYFVQIFIVSGGTIFLVALSVTWTSGSPVGWTHSCLRFQLRFLLLVTLFLFLLGCSSPSPSPSLPTLCFCLLRPHVSCHGFSLLVCFCSRGRP